MTDIKTEIVEKSDDEIATDDPQYAIELGVVREAVREIMRKTVTPMSLSYITPDGGVQTDSSCGRHERYQRTFFLGVISHIGSLIDRAYFDHDTE